MGHPANSFSNDAGLSVSVGDTIKEWGAGLMGSTGITGTSSTDYTQSSMGSMATTVTKQSSFQLPISGVADSFNPVNHDYDRIWLWLNPLSTFTLDPNYPANLTWNGYAYNSDDAPGMDVYSVYAGQLNGHIAFSQADIIELSRAWDANQWPSGQGPGLTQADYDQIITFDVFANCSYYNATAIFTNCTDITEDTGGGNFTNPLGSASADGRFTLVQGLNEDIPYQQTVSTVQPRAIVYQESTSDQTVNTMQTSHSVKQAFTLEEKFNTSVSIGLFTDILNVDLKQSDTMTWTHTFTQATTTTTTNTSSFSITGPTCTVLGSGCSPSYAGPPEFWIYQDNLFGTFLFYPKN